MSLLARLSGVACRVAHMLHAFPFQLRITPSLQPASWPSQYPRDTSYVNAQLHIVMTGHGACRVLSSLLLKLIARRSFSDVKRQ